jgi:hypothetical protein
MTFDLFSDLVTYTVNPFSVLDMKCHLLHSMAVITVVLDQLKYLCSHENRDVIFVNQFLDALSENRRRKIFINLYLGVNTVPRLKSSWSRVSTDQYIATTSVERRSTSNIIIIAVLLISPLSLPLFCLMPAWGLLLNKSPPVGATRPHPTSRLTGAVTRWQAVFQE